MRTFPRAKGPKLHWPTTKIDREQVARFCRERGIRKLSLFGSVLHHDFDPQRSDVDVLAEFEPGVLKNAGFQYFG